MKKRIWSLLLVLIMVMSMFVGSGSALADDGSSSIKINIPSEDSGVTFKAYQILEVEYNGAGDQIIGYMWTEQMGAWIKSKEAWTDLEANDLSTMTPETTAKLLNALAEALPMDWSSKESIKSDDKTHTISGLNLGQYIVLGSGGINVYSPMLATLLPKWNGNEWTKSATDTLDAKCTTPSIDKEIVVGEGEEAEKVKEDTVAIGDIVKFEITATVPWYDKADSIIYTITDTLSDGLEFNNNAVIVCGNGGTVTIEPNVEEIKASESTTATKITWEFGSIYNDIKSKGEGKSSTITITYSATVTKIAPANPETNTAGLTYTNDPFTSSDPKYKEVEVKVYTYGIEIFKYAQDKDSNVKTGLAGAEFELRKQGETDALLFVDEGAGVYRLANASEIGTEAASTILTSSDGVNTLGKIIIHGLDIGIYELKETKAPGGYNLMTKPTTIEIKKETVNRVVLTNVENRKGVELPSTGGIGTTLFTVIGIVLMAGVVIALLAMNRKKTNTGK